MLSRLDYGNSVLVSFRLVYAVYSWCWMWQCGWSAVWDPQTTSLMHLLAFTGCVSLRELNIRMQYWRKCGVHHDTWGCSFRLLVLRANRHCAVPVSVTCWCHRSGCQLLETGLYGCWFPSGMLCRRRQHQLSHGWPSVSISKHDCSGSLIQTSSSELLSVYLFKLFYF